MKKKKLPIESHDLATAPSLEERLHDSAIFQWMVSNAQQLLIALAAVAAALFLLYKFYAPESVGLGNNYQKAEEQIAGLKNSFADGDEAEQSAFLQSVQKILAANAALQAKYDGEVAELLIANGQPDEALPFAERTLARTASDDLKFYHSFSHTTLLIAQEKTSQALEQAKALDLEIRAQGTENLLFAYNLVRIAFLEQALGREKEEVKAWQEVKKFATAESVTPAFKTVINLFSEGQMTLINYLNERITAAQSSQASEELVK